MNRFEIIRSIEQKYVKKELPPFNVGDTVRMRVKVLEAEKVRVHPFEGIVICKKGSGVRGTFTVRKISFGEGVERIFPMYSPTIESLEVVSHGDVERAKLYYLRERIGKKTRVQQKIEKPLAAAKA